MGQFETNLGDESLGFQNFNVGSTEMLHCLNSERDYDNETLFKYHRRAATRKRLDKAPFSDTFESTLTGAVEAKLVL